MGLEFVLSPRASTEGHILGYDADHEGAKGVHGVKSLRKQRTTIGLSYRFPLKSALGLNFF